MTLVMLSINRKVVSGLGITSRGITSRAATGGCEQERFSRRRDMIIVFQ